MSVPFDFEDPRLGDVSDGARMLHYVLTAAASTARGRFPAGPRALTRHLRLTDVAAVAAQLAELVDAGAVRVYEGCVDGTRVVTGELVLGRPRRAPSKLAELGADPLPQPPDDGESRRRELSATSPQGSPKAQASAQPAPPQTPERESSLSTARAKTRSTRKSKPREQLALGAPVEAEVEVPEPIRAAVETWEAHATSLRARGVAVPSVARADLVALAEGVEPVDFVEAVGHHVRSEPRYWGSPLVLLAKRVEWAVHGRLHVTPSVVPLEGRLAALAASPSSGVADLARAALEPPSSPLSSAPRGDLSARRAADTLTTIPDDDWAEDWTRARDRLRELLEPWDWSHWIEPLDGRGVTVDGEPVLRAPDSAHRDWVAEHFGGWIEGALGYRPRLDVYESPPGAVDLTPRYPSVAQVGRPFGSPSQPGG